MTLYDPNQSVQNALEKLRTATVNASAAQKIAQQDYQKAQAEADKWEQKYLFALKEGHKDLISQAQFQKERYQAIASRLKKLVVEQISQVETMKSNLASLETKVSKADNKENKILQIEVSSKFVLQPDNFHEDISTNFDDIDNELKRLKEELSSPLKLQGQSTVKNDVKPTLAEAIYKTKEAVNTTVTNKKCIQKDYDKAQEEVKFWHTKAYIALKNNDDNLAIEATLNKKVQNQIALTLQTQLQQQEATLAVLRQNLMILENFKQTLGNDTKH